MQNLYGVFNVNFIINFEQFLAHKLMLQLSNCRKVKLRNKKEIIEFPF